MKSSWSAVPENWGVLGKPPAGTTIDLCVAFKPHIENALIDAPRHVLSVTPLRTDILTHVTALI